MSLIYVRTNVPIVGNAIICIHCTQTKCIVHMDGVLFIFISQICEYGVKIPQNVWKLTLILMHCHIYSFTKNIVQRKPLIMIHTFLVSYSQEMANLLLPIKICKRGKWKDIHLSTLFRNQIHHAFVISPNTKQLNVPNSHNLPMTTQMIRFPKHEYYHDCVNLNWN